MEFLSKNERAIFTRQTVLDSKSNIEIDLVKCDASHSAICCKCGNFMKAFEISWKFPFDKMAEPLFCWICEVCNFEG